MPISRELVQRLDTLKEASDKHDEKLDKIQESTDNKLGKLQDDITVLKVGFGKLEVKSGVWGALSGVVVAVGAIIISKFKP